MYTSGLVIGRDSATELTREQADELIAGYGTPLYVYDSAALRERAAEALGLSLPFGYKVRYAVKANPHPGIIALFAKAGLHFDASSSYEASELLDLGIAGESISLASQQPAHNLPRLLGAGVRYVVTSMHQLELFARVAAPDSRVALRINPGTGSGDDNRRTTGGVGSSFGLWHEYLEEALMFAKKRHIVIDRLHVHIGSGADAGAWSATMDTALAMVARMPGVTVLDIGGGYKVRRFDGETETDMRQVAAVFAARLTAFAKATGRQLHLEIEPGTWLVAHAGRLISEIVDVVDTGKDGFSFLRLNTGMNDFLRPTLYGAQHEIRVLSDTSERADYVVVGHNCETGDILTTAAGNPEVIAPRTMRKARIGDLVVIDDVGAYCGSLRAKGYNAFPNAREVLV